MGSGLKPGLLNVYLNTGPRVHGWVQRALAAVSPQRRAVELYWSAACPYSAVMAQQLHRMTAGSDVVVRVLPVPLGAEDVNPAPGLREGHGPRDCASLAAFYDVAFPAAWSMPSADTVARANAIVAKAPSLDTCVAVSAPLWEGDGRALEGMASASPGETEGLLAANAAKQRAGGHYHPGSVRYHGEWFEGPMRMPLVGERLRAAGHSVGEALTARAAPLFSPAPAGTPLELWFSFRSPYSYLAVAQLQRWRDAGDAFEIVLRPLLPMVMRGLAVPTTKKLYLVKDSAREARRLGIPFGRIADPVGAGAERCLAVCAELGADPRRAFDFAVSAARGIWSEGHDVATERGMSAVAERAGVTRDELGRALANMAAGAALAEANRIALAEELGLWGVPSYRVGAWVSWGQDRLPLVRHALGLARR